jgi:preprotein translocase subunit SecE
MDRKWTFVIFACGAVVLAYLFYETGNWIWEALVATDFAGDYVGKPNLTLISVGAVLLSLGAAAVALRNERLVELSGEVAAELKKVTWPTREETFAATIVVIVTVIVASLFLGIFDSIWSNLAKVIYNG